MNLRKHKDDAEPINAIWLTKIGLRNSGEPHDHDYETVISVDERTETTVYDEEVTYVGYSMTSNTAYLEVFGDGVTKEVILLGPRKTRREFRFLLLALGAWNEETQKEIHRSRVIAGEELTMLPDGMHAALKYQEFPNKQYKESSHDAES